MDMEDPDAGLSDAIGGAVEPDVFRNSRNIDDSTLKEWAEDRSSWTKSIRSGLLLAHQINERFSKLFQQKGEENI